MNQAQTASYRFNDQGHLLWSDDGTGRTIFTYDEAGRLSAAVSPTGELVSLSYDEQGRLAARRLSGSTAQRFTYNRLGQVIRADFEDGSLLHYEYDSFGRLLKAVSGACTNQFEYSSDDSHQPNHCSLQVVMRDLSKLTAEAEFQYNAAGQITAFRIPVPGRKDQPLRVHYEYDDQNRLIAFGIENQPALVRLEYSGSENNGSQIRIQYANGVTQSLDLARDSRIQRIDVHTKDDRSLLDIVYRSDRQGSISAAGEQRYAYNRSRQLIEFGPLLSARTRLDYDSSGNRRSARLPDGRTVHYRYDAAGRLEEAVTSDEERTGFGYTSTGEQAWRIGTGQEWEYHWDAAARMTHAVHNSQTVAHYFYDHANRRVLQESDQVTLTLRDPWGNRLAEFTCGETRLFIGPPGQPFVCLVFGPNEMSSYFFHADHLGSIRAVTDPAGELLARYDYDPFGNLLPSSWWAAGMPDFQIFAGHPYDRVLDLYDGGIRLYDPRTGRFLSQDPYTFSADDPRLLWLPVSVEARKEISNQRLRSWLPRGANRNRYIYALNDPLTYIDPDGHSTGAYALYIISSILWSSPYTIAGFLFFEFWLNWVTFAWAWDHENHEWLGESSDRLGAWAWWTVGGVAGKLVKGGGAFTLGNFVIANADFIHQLRANPAKSFAIPTHFSELAATPFDNNTLLTEYQATVEHELRHTNQYGWWGPFMMPWVLLVILLFNAAVLTGVLALTKVDVRKKWETVGKGLFGDWVRGLITVGSALVVMPGAYWWDYIFRGGYSSSFFERNAAQYSGVSTGIDMGVYSSQDHCGPNGDVTITVVTDQNLVGGISGTITSSNSNTPTLVDITPPAIVNLRVFKYTAGANQATDELKFTDGSKTETIKIEVK